ncbi:MAG: YhjD/YihY/BrkB family envelope integrity protein [Acidimicrobiales bacterium]|nr:YhjD/YihY/BrkB family envelope integrity protein [Acidimicrobiales bacterium]
MSPTPDSSPTSSTFATITSVALALKQRISDHHAPIFAAAVAFFAFLALIPALTALIGVYGLVADPDEVTRQISESLSGAPETTRTFLVDQMSEIAAGSSGALGASVGIGLLFALFSASGATANLVKALNVAYEIEETRKPWTLRGVSLLLTIGAIAVLGVVVFLMAALPTVLRDAGDGLRWALNIGRYPILALVMAATLSLLYRLGPDHGGNDRPLSPRLFTAGGLLATGLFVSLSALFSYYTANLGSYGETYGPLATIIVLLVWFQLSALSVIVGAELDAELADREWRARTGLELPEAAAGDAHAAADRWITALGEHDVEAILAGWHRRGVHHHPLFGRLAVPDELRRHLDDLLAAFPDLSVVVEDITATGDTATVRHRLVGTFTGTAWRGVEPNGRELDLTSVAFLRLDDGFIVDVEELFDTAALVEQLGFRPGDRSASARVKQGVANLITRLRPDRAAPQE